MSTTASSMLSQGLQDARVQVEAFVRDLHGLAVDIRKPEMAEVLDDLRERIREPFLFVICGEVKAGKSSFINALLGTGREIAKVAPQPMTDTVQEILYGEDESTVEVNPHFKKIFLPVPILREIAIVDTPGTNTIVAHHQEITERFVPGSDLVVFVFEAKNPYRQSAWEFFDYIHGDWRRKVIFVLQQKDLMDPEDLAVNVDGVRRQAIEKGVDEPRVFAVSALEEMRGARDESGFGELFAYIEANITGGKAATLKIENALDTAGQMLRRVSDGLDERRDALRADEAFRGEVRATLARYDEQARRQIDVLVENLVGAYDKSTRKREQELERGLAFPTLVKRAVVGMFSAEAGTKAWLEAFAKIMQTDLSTQLSNRLTDGVNDLAESLQNMTQTVHLQVQQKAMALPSDQVFFTDVADKRAAILLELREAFDRFIARSDNFDGEELFGDREGLSSNLLTGGGIAVIGAVMAAVTQAAAFDVTGGIMTAVGLLFAGVTTTVKRRQVLREYRKEVGAGRDKLAAQVREKLEGYVGLIRERVDDQFKQLDHHLARERDAVKGLEARIATLGERLQEIALR